MNQDQLVKQQGGGYQNVYPLTYIQSIVDAESNEKLSDILVKYNHLYLNWQGSQENTRLSIPILIRKHGLWISYDMNGTLYTEWFKGNNITSLIDNVWKDSTNWERIPDLKFVEDASQRIPTGAILPEMLSPALQQLLAKQHNITNLVDDEDLESKCNVIRLKDKEYNPYTASGLGRKRLRKNWVKGRNLLTQEMINQPNTIYDIQYDYDLNGATITIPEGCTLNFTGGSFKDGIVILSDTIIDTNYYCLNNVKLRGYTPSVFNLKAIGVGHPNNSNSFILNNINSILGDEIKSLKIEGLVILEDNNISLSQHVQIIGENDAKLLFKSSIGDFCISVSDRNTLSNISIISDNKDFSGSIMMASTLIRDSEKKVTPPNVFRLENVFISQKWNSEGVYNATGITFLASNKDINDAYNYITGVTCQNLRIEFVKQGVCIINENYNYTSSNFAWSNSFYFDKLYISSTDIGFSSISNDMGVSNKAQSVGPHFINNYSYQALRMSAYGIYMDGMNIYINEVYNYDSTIYGKIKKGVLKLSNQGVGHGDYPTEDFIDSDGVAYVNKLNYHLYGTAKLIINTTVYSDDSLTLLRRGYSAVRGTGNYRIKTTPHGIEERLIDVENRGAMFTYVNKDANWVATLVNSGSAGADDNTFELRQRDKYDVMTGVYGSRVGDIFLRFRPLINTASFSRSIMLNNVVVYNFKIPNSTLLPNKIYNVSISFLFDLQNQKVGYNTFKTATSDFVFLIMSISTSGGVTLLDSSNMKDNDSNNIVVKLKTGNETAENTRITIIVKHTNTADIRVQDRNQMPLITDTKEHYMSDALISVAEIGAYKGTSGIRPTLTPNDASFQYYDTTLKKYICWNGTAWTNLDGTTLI